MMWWMMASCLLLPLAFLLFGGRSGGFSSNWLWFSIIGVFILAHILMMFGGRGHGESKEEDPERQLGPAEKPSTHEHH